MTGTLSTMKSLLVCRYNKEATNRNQIKRSHKLHDVENMRTSDQS